MTKEELIIKLKNLSQHLHERGDHCGEYDGYGIGQAHAANDLDDIIKEVETGWFVHKIDLEAGGQATVYINPKCVDVVKGTKE